MAGTATDARLRVLAAWRAARHGVVTAVWEVLRDMLPADAKVKGLAGAILEGRFDEDKDGLTLKKLLDVASPPEWMGGSDVTWADKKSQQAKELVQLSQALSVLSLTMTLMHPSDSSVTRTMTAVQAEISKGCRTLTAADAVQGVLVPFLREMSERWESFHKSSSADMPVFSEGWEKVRKGRAIGEFMLRASQATIAMSQPSAATGGKEAASKGHVKQLEQQLRSMSKRLSAFTDDEEEEESTQQNEGGRGHRGNRKAGRGGKGKGGKGGGPPAIVDITPTQG